MNGRLLKALCAAFLISAAHAQGTINFSTFVPEAGVNAPFRLGHPDGPGLGPSFSAGLYYSAAPGSSFLLPGSLTAFQSPVVDPNRAAYIEPRIVELAGKLTGERVTLRMGAWLSYFGNLENAAPGTWVLSPPFDVILGGDGAPPGNLPSTFSGAVIPLAPEPSVLALAALFFAAIVLRRRVG